MQGFVLNPYVSFHPLDLIESSDFHFRTKLVPIVSLFLSSLIFPGRISYHPLHFIPSVGAVGSTSVLNSTLATSKYQSVAGHVGDTSSLARGGAHGTSSLNAIPNNIFLNNSLSNSSFHNLNASKSCKSQLFSVQD